MYMEDVSDFLVLKVTRAFWKGLGKGRHLSSYLPVAQLPRLAPSALSFRFLCLSGKGDCSQAGSAEVFGETTLTPLFWFLF